MSYDWQRKEIDSYQAQISAYEDRMAESTTRSLRHLEDAYQCGAEAARELKGQTEQLDRVEQNLERIEVSCEKSDRNLTNVQTVFGGVINYFKRDKTAKNDTTNIRPSSHLDPTPYNPQVARGGYSEPKSVIDRNLDQLDSGLDMLNDMALKLGDQIDESNVQLDRISTKQENVNTKIDNLNRKVRKMY